ncbi:hypothetical protein ACDW_30510 [Acidovorax sp. DW039]|uniref:hypothetical protein n=1 Tax=Acidovorax sp. DW039 TaxID=3095606 RepID=UPI003086AAE0|nr:hypothetical protein ACDW_30510 [Acidovorax sp. DW039]
MALDAWGGELGVAGHCPQMQAPERYQSDSSQSINIFNHIKNLIAKNITTRKLPRKNDLTLVECAQRLVMHTAFL